MSCEVRVLENGFGYGVSLDDFSISDDKLFTFINKHPKYAKKLFDVLSEEDINIFRSFDKLTDEEKSDFLDKIGEFGFDGYGEIGYKARIISMIMSEEEGYKFTAVHDDESDVDMILIVATCPWDTDDKNIGLDEKTACSAFEKYFSELTDTDIYPRYLNYSEYVDPEAIA